MKAIILAAGKGTRMRPLTNQIPKPLIPICNFPTLIFVINKILYSGIDNIGLVISPHDKEKFAEFINKFNLDKKVNIIIQETPLGVAHAVKTARNFIKNEDFLLYLGDNLIQDELEIYKNKFQNDSPDALLLLKEIDDPKMFGVAELNSNNELIGIEEKPSKPKSNLAVTGIYFFKNKILKEINQISFSERGELEITDAIDNLVGNGFVKGFKLQGWWIDTGNRKQILEANSFIMKEIINGSYSNLYENYERKDNYLIGVNSKLNNVKVNGYAVIGNDVILNSTNLNNNVSVSSNSNISNSLISNSIILEQNYCENFEIINSLIGTKYKKGVNKKIKDIIDA
ncbi:MAG: sugar phosphate nucleotidyltransferase [Dehalococcoidia bacterium]|tara:strand:+ start:2887 stop:3912 length:1026 start_codon:yes stop_codon:yes gene_type:complete